ncbi:MAG: site-2 protease family protein [Sphingobium sp.]|nr:site-2 protease family protein [Sphingobium sp.]
MGGPSLGFTILSFLLVIGPLVFVHEMGHYLVGRWFGVHAETFSIGFGPELAHWTDKRGTRWRVGALPLGGYVKFLGDMGVASEPDPKWLELPARERNRCFHFKPIWQRALIVFAGPAINLLFAALILAGFAYAYGENVTPTRVTGFERGSVAEQAGVRKGDIIRTFDGEKVHYFPDLKGQVVMRAPGERIELGIERNGKQLTLRFAVGAAVEKDRFGNEHRYGVLGVHCRDIAVRHVSLLEAPLVGVRQTGTLIASMAEGLARIITGHISITEMGGPLKMAQFSGEQAAQGPIALVTFIALVSINLGFINLLPIPMLDGGHLLFYGIEAIQRRPVSVRVQEIAFRSGLAFILGLMVLVTINDLLSFGLWRGLSRLIG